jgi:uncharacterized MAPEG superfamily protein
MEEFWLRYASLAHAWLWLGIAVLAQVIVADVAGVRSRHVPGTPVTGGHDDFLFRATRAHANSNENLPLFLLAALAAAGLGASPAWTGYLAWIFTIARIAHMLCYYADLRAARSLAFGVGLAATVGLLAITVARLL